MSKRISFYNEFILILSLLIEHLFWTMISKKIQEIERFSFSGHETFQCKSLWLKKGYDFIKEGKKFTVEDAVVDLGVGKNMVTAIRFWLRAFGMTKNDEITEIADYIFDNNDGKDPFIEDLGTLWLLHYMLVASLEASIYSLFFVVFQKEKKEFTRDQLFLFLKRKALEKGNPNWYNDNTIRKDISVLIHNYQVPDESKAFEDFLVLLIDLNLIVETEKNHYSINYEGKQRFIPDILLYAIIDQKGEDIVMSYEDLFEIALVFCLSQSELDENLRILEEKYPTYIRFTDDSGIKQLLFIRELDKNSVLDFYYERAHEA